MREILFRGKPKNLKSHQWVHGQLLHHSETISKIYSDELDYPVGVIPDTVGQFTGLIDKNGKKIFEGDIVQYYGTYALEVFIEEGHTKIRWFDTVTDSECKDMFYGYSEDEYGECEVIGNIHDNPELMEVNGNANH